MSKDTSVIPKGIYCHGNLSFSGRYDNLGWPILEADNMCPYWKRLSDKPEQGNGYCSYLEKGDGEKDDNGNAIYLLWDQVKECEINMDDDEEPSPELEAAIDDMMDKLKIAASKSDHRK